MRIFAIILILVAFVAIENCEEDVYSIGPYKISFDLGIPKSAFVTNTTGPITSKSFMGYRGTKYELDLVNKTGMARLISITVFSRETDQVIPSASDQEKLLRSMISSLHGAYNIQSNTRQIDDVEGAIASAKTQHLPGFEIPLYFAMYYPKFDQSNVFVMLTSSYPWDEGTLSLLESIHVEKVNATA
jgi:hypothetical protein